MVALGLMALEEKTIEGSLDIQFYINKYPPPTPGHDQFGPRGLIDRNYVRGH